MDHLDVEAKQMFPAIKAEAMWAVLTDWNGPYIDGAGVGEKVLSVEGEGVGAKRTIGVGPTGDSDPKMQFREELTAQDNDAMLLSYRFCDGTEKPGGSPFPIANFVGTVSVMKLGDGCSVTWAGSVDFTCPPEERFDLVGLLNMFITAAAAQVK